MKRFKFLALATMLLVPLAACDEGEGDLIPPAVTGTIQGTATVDGTGRAGLTVSLSTGQTATTSATGTYSFTNVTEGAHTVSLSGIPADVTFPTTSGTAVIATQGQVATVNFAGTTLRTSNIVGSVTANGQPIAGATVTATGGTPSESRTGNTNAAGQFTITGLRAGTYSVAVSGLPATIACAPGQSPQSTTLAAGQTNAINFVCASTATSTIGGSVRIDGVVAAGVIVTLNSADGDPAVRDTTDAAGNFSFAGLHPDTYTLVVTPPAGTTFPTTSGSVVVTSPGNFTVNFTGVTVRNSAIVGSVTSAGAALGGVIVTLSGARSAVDTTDATGQYGFAGLSAGSYTVTLSNLPSSTVISPTSQTVTLGENQTQIVNFAGTPPANGVVSGQLFLDGNGNGTFQASADSLLRAANVRITLGGPGVGDPTRNTNTDATGFFSFTGLAAGTYTITLDVTDPDLPAGVSLIGGAPAATRIISVSPGLTTSADYGFSVVTQTVRAFAVMGRDTLAAKGPGVGGVVIDLYRTQSEAVSGLVADRIGTATTNSSGTATFTFARTVDYGPGFPAIPGSDNVVFAKVRTVPGTLVLDGPQTDIIEVAYTPLQSSADAPDRFDVLNTLLEIKLEAVSTGANRSLVGWDGMAAEGLDTLTLGPATTQTTGVTGRTVFGVTIDWTAAANFHNLGDTFWVRLADDVAEPQPPTDETFFQTPLNQDVNLAAGDGDFGRWLRVVHTGLRAPGDTTGGLEIVTWTEADVTARVHHEQDDVFGFTATDNTVGAGAISVQLRRVSDFVIVAGPVAAAADGYVTFDDVPIRTASRAPIPYWIEAISTVGRTQVVLENDLFQIADGNRTLGSIDGSYDFVRVCPLGTDTTVAACSTFAQKFQDATITGSAASAGGAFPVGVKVIIRPAPNNIVAADLGDIGGKPDTVVFIGAGGGFTVTGMLEGPWIATLDDSVTTAAGDTIWFPTGNVSDTVDLQGSGDLETAGPGPVPGPFTVASDEITVQGIVANDRDNDDVVLDGGEAGEGVTINLYRDNVGTPSVSVDSLVGTATTNSLGAYSFTDLREGRYIVQAVNPVISGAVVLSGFITATGVAVDTQIVITGPTAGEGPADTTGYVTPTLANPLPRWDYPTSTVENGNPANFTYLFNNGTVVAFVTDASVVPVPLFNRAVDIRRCDDSPPPPALPPVPPGACISYMPFPGGATIMTQNTDAAGRVSWTGLQEGVYEVRPQVPSTPPSRLYTISGSGDTETASFTIP